MWTDKYRPETLSEYRGLKKEKKELKKWVNEWERNTEPVLLHGQAGTGKTSLVEALSNDLDLELVETNASDVRTKKQLKEELKEATRQKSFFGKQKLILIDEVDGMSSTDRGGIKEISTIVDESRFPVIMTANDAYSQNIQTLRNKSKLIKVDSVHTNSINAHLKEILEKEGIEYDDAAVKRIARGAGGQMRTAINDLQTAAIGKEKLTVEDVKKLSQRDNRQEIFNSLKIIFKTKNFNNADQATENLDEDHGTMMEWIRENIPREYKKTNDISNAYHWISKADLFNQRIRRRQNWKLLKYVYKFSTVGVALSKEEKYSGFTRYQYPSKIKRLGSSKAARQKLDNISSKISTKMHISKREAKDSIKFLNKLMEDKEDISDQLEFTEDEKEFIKNF